MAKDYKHRAQANERRNRPKTGLRWLLAIILIGAFSAFLLGLSDGGHEPRQPRGEMPRSSIAAPSQNAPTSSPTEAARIAQKKAVTAEQGEHEKASTQRPASSPAPRFTFYKILPEKEMVIPEKDIRTIKREERRGKALAGERYMLQAGAYRRPKDAEKLKAQLAALGIGAKIEKVAIDNVDWLRIKIGPFTSMANADKIRSRLRLNRIDSIVQKTTKE